MDSAELWSKMAKRRWFQWIGFSRNIWKPGDFLAAEYGEATMLDQPFHGDGLVQQIQEKPFVG